MESPGDRGGTAGAGASARDRRGSRGSRGRARGRTPRGSAAGRTDTPRAAPGSATGSAPAPRGAGRWASASGARAAGRRRDGRGARSCGSLEGGVELVEGLLDALRPIKAPGAPDDGRSIPRPIKRVPQGTGEGGGVSAGHEEAVLPVAHDLRRAAHGRGYHGRAAGEGLE